MNITSYSEYKERQETKDRLEQLERKIAKLRVVLAAAEEQAAGAEEIVLRMEAQANFSELPKEDAKRARAELPGILGAPAALRVDLRRKLIESDILEQRYLDAQRRLEAKVAAEVRPTAEAYLQALAALYKANDALLRVNDELRQQRIRAPMPGAKELSFLAENGGQPHYRLWLNSWGFPYPDLVKRHGLHIRPTDPASALDPITNRTDEKARTDAELRKEEQARARQKAADKLRAAVKKRMGQTSEGKVVIEYYRNKEPVIKEIWGSWP
jgi:hypothetical protein